MLHRAACIMYGVDDGTRTTGYSQHAKPGMVDVKSKRCRQQGCFKIPPYGVDDGGNKTVYCCQHAEAGMVDAKNNRCAQQGWHHNRRVIL